MCVCVCVSEREREYVERRILLLLRLIFLYPVLFTSLPLPWFSTPFTPARIPVSHHSSHASTGNPDRLLKLSLHSQFPQQCSQNLPNLQTSNKNTGCISSSSTATVSPRNDRIPAFHPRHTIETANPALSQAQKCLLEAPRQRRRQRRWETPGSGSRTRDASVKRVRCVNGHWQRRISQPLCGVQGRVKQSQPQPGPAQHSPEPTGAYSSCSPEQPSFSS